MPDAAAVGKQLVELCQQGKNMDAVNTLYADDIESVEPCSAGDMPNPMKGIDAIRGKSEWWYDNHEVHGGDVKGPFPHGEDRFAAYFSMDITHKPSDARMQIEEVALYTVKDGKIVKEEFFYDMEPPEAPEGAGG